MMKNGPVTAAVAAHHNDVDDDHEAAVRTSRPRPFSVVLAPEATVTMRGSSSPFVRYLNCGEGTGDSLAGVGHKRAAGEESGGNSSAPQLSDVIFAVKAQPCTLHLFLGRRLCRIIEFSSPIVDVAGLLPPRAPRAGQLLFLCVVVCRDGTTYALPAAEVLEGKRGPTADTSSYTEATATECGEQISKKKRSSDNGTSRIPAASSTRAHELGIFDDMAPTIAYDTSPSIEQPQQGQSCVDKGASVGGTSLGGLVLLAQDRWAICTHFGARRVATCPGSTAAIVGIVDRASLYRLPSVLGETGVACDASPSRGTRFLSTLGGVDGAAPTTVAVVWSDEDQEGASGGGGDARRADIVGANTIRNTKSGFSLPRRVFTALFGAELALWATPFPPQQTKSPAVASDGNSKARVALPPEDPAKGPAVLLVGDQSGSVRWAPLHRCPGVGGGILIRLGDQAVVTINPRIDSRGKTIGLLVVGAKGVVVSLADMPRRGSRKRVRPETGVGGRGGPGGESTSADRDQLEETPLPCLRRRDFQLPFRISAGCATPGFLVHCHAGALFASAIPQDELSDEGNLDRWDMRSTGGELLDSFGTKLCLRPVRLPLPCETIDIAVARVLTGDKGTRTGTPSLAMLASERTLVMSLSARGRLIGFLAPESPEELQGWGLDTGKGGVRVGGTAGIERRVRCQLERLSNVGLQCAALSAESAKRDDELRILRGATRLIPTLVAGGGDWDGGAVSPSFGYAVSMSPDVEQVNASSEEASGGAGGTLRVRLHVRLWSLDGARATNLPEPGAEGIGRWFLTTQILSETATAAGRGGGIENRATAEGWAWSTSAAVPMSSLRQGRTWSTSVPVTLPSARPVVTISWLQFLFAGGNVCVSAGAADGVAAAHRVIAGACVGATRVTDSAKGVCVELGSARFDILDWSLPLPSVPASTAAVRAAAPGRGASFCGPQMAVVDVLENNGKSPISGPRNKGGRAFASNFSMSSIAPVGTRILPAAWRNFRLVVASTDSNTGDLLARLLGTSRNPSFTQAHHTPLAPVASVRSERARSGDDSAEVAAVRVAGQVAVFRATWSSGAGGGAEAAGLRGRRAEKTVEITVTCSHESMSPLVREALLRRAGAMLQSKDCQDDVEIRGEAAEALSRELHPLRQAVHDASDSARALGVAWVRDGPQLATAREALSVMGKVGEIYQALRLHQGGGAVV
ncbi:unnamed protein product [Sphacelaria rigidula]